MRRRPLVWFVISIICFCGAVYFWRLGDRWAARKDQDAKKQAAQSVSSSHRSVKATPLLSSTPQGSLNVPPAASGLTNHILQLTNRLALRLSNTSATMHDLQGSPTAILLENALIDTKQKTALAIPDNLRSQGDPGTYIVQAKGPTDNAFRAALQNAGATIISYIPNNAYLVRASQGVAAQLSAAADEVQDVEPYEPYYKLKPSLLQRAIAGEDVPANTPINVLLFADDSAATQNKMSALGLGVYPTDESPFGPVVTVVATNTYPNLLATLAGLSGVQEMEWTARRRPANDLSRVAVGVSTDTLVPTNYLNLTGTNVVVNVNDSGVDATQPDLAPRVNSPDTNALKDPNGHGTHVAGIIASSGAHSTTPVNVGAIASGSVSNASFRGAAPAAGIYALQIDMFTGPFQQGAEFFPSDSYLQQTPAKTNIFISNNSWNYVGTDAQSYDLHAASYDAAVRDALPFVTGSQPLLIVFPSGNIGGGNDEGTGGNPDTIESPATAKNVITVGAIEQIRNITNQVTKCTTVDGNQSCTTNEPWLGMTDAGDEVASFSSRGNVGVNIEGQYGRFKPDLVAPGTFVVSTKSQQWDTNAYYNPTSHIYGYYPDVVVLSNSLFVNAIFVPSDAVQLNISVFPNTNSPVPFPDTPIYVRQLAPPTNPPPDYDFVGTNSISLPPDHPLNPVGVGWFYALGNNTTQAVDLDLLTDLVVTNDLGNYLQVLAGMNDALGPDYRYESGTSMASADVSGVLALMQEFFQRMGRTNSPALMKALLINGARSVGPLYDFNPHGAVNFQGWGLINLPTAIPGALTNQTVGTNAIFVQDQSPTNALATGDSRTYKVSLSLAARNQPLRVTLVWTDPPGNPVASIKLVNDLDLIVTNLDNTNLVYFGNDIPAGHEDSNQPWDTNSPPNIDTVNNVENVFLSPDFGENSVLATNYSITVVGRRVNVNAVTAQTNNVVQDYALVISCGDGVVTNGIGFNASAPIVFSNSPLVTVITNAFGATSSNYSGGILLNQHVGANAPLLGTNTIALTNDANGIMTLGMTNQWHFYVITNINGFTNAAFLTFLPPTLALPRMGVYSASDANSTRPQADIDLFVAPPSIPNNYALTNLDPNVIAASAKSLSRGGTETIIMSNATPGVYYIGVQSEDQMAAEYALIGIFSRFPFGSTDQNGDQSLVGFPAPAPIPDGSPEAPGYTYVMAIAAQPTLVRRVVVTNTVQHELMTDLLGTLSHNQQNVVLNNHTCVFDPVTSSCETCTTYIYDDSSEMNVTAGVTICPPSVQHTDGPGSLNNFAGVDGSGQWMLTMTDNATNHIGTNILMEIFLEKQPDLTVGHGVTFTLQPGACRDDFVQVPVDAISLSVTAAVVTATPPIDFSLTVCPLNGNVCKSVQVTNAVGGGVTTDLNDIPPLLPGTTYSVRTCNLGLSPLTLNLRAFFGFSQNTVMPVVSTNTTQPVNILDDAVTDVFLTNDIHSIISSLDVGLLINDPRISDLAITLISPNGTRVLLFENRGGTSTNGLGTFNIITNYLMVPFYTNNFDLAAVGPYFPGAKFEGWSVLSNSVSVLDDYTCLCLSNHILMLMDAGVSNTIPTTNSLPQTNSMPYSLAFNVTHSPYLEGTVTWWPLDTNAVDIFGGFNGLLLGDVTFSTGPTNAFFDDFAGPLSPAWTSPLPTTGTGAGPSPILPYAGTPGYTFGLIGTNTVINLASTLTSQTRVGWISTNIFKGQTFRYETRFNTLTQGPGTSQGGFIEVWIIDAANSNRYDVISPFGSSPGSGNVVYIGSSIENSYNAAPFNYQNNTWYRLVISALPNQGVHAAVLDDSGNELAGVNFIHGASAFPAGFQIGLSQFVGTLASPGPVNVAVDTVSVMSGLLGEVNQAYYGDGDATRIIVPGCSSLDLGLGRGFSIEGWINPVNVTNPAPLLEWDDLTNVAPLGVQFWLALTNGPGSLGAAIWDTNLQPHIVTTPPGVLTNAGWQHVALTYDTNSGFASLYVNGTTNNLPLVTTNLGRFVPRTYASIYLGYHPDISTNSVCYAGGLDEFGLYNRALSPCEVTAIFNAGPRGKYGTNVLVCPVTTEVTLATSLGPQVFVFTNGLTWTNTGPVWETNVINFSTSGTNPTPIVVRGLDPYSSVTNVNAANNLNVALDNFVLSGLAPQYFNGMLNFTEDTNLATLPIKFAPTPFSASNTPPVLIFSNNFSLATQGVYQVGMTIAGSTNDPSVGNRVWTVTNGPVTVISNAILNTIFTNCLALSTGAVQCLLPTTPGHLYQLSYTMRGPCAVGWWNGTVDALSDRAEDLISGNNGAFINGATNTTAAFLGDTSQAFVGLSAFYFTGQTEPPPNEDPDIFPEDIDDPASKIELADPPQLQFTNAFTIEGWVKPMLSTNEETVCGTEQIFFRGYPEPLDCGGAGDPYWLALTPAADDNPLHFDIRFHIASAHSGGVAADVFTTNGPVQIGGGTNDGWWHITAVFDKPYTNLVVTNGTNVITLSTNALRIYLNGVCVATNYTRISPYADLDPALSPGATIGGRCRYDWTQPFTGLMDEVTVYARALTDPEISAIASAGEGGQGDMTVPAQQSLAELTVAVDGTLVATSHGNNSSWTSNTVQFTALDTNAVVTIQSLLPGTLLEGITLTELPSELYYLPEVSLSTLFGEDGFGVWTLEIWDNRAGPGFTNLAQLIEWQLNFGLGPSNPPPVIDLSHGIPYTNTLPAGEIQYFIASVPQWATNATNVLLFADRYQTLNPLPVTVYFNPTNYPALSDLALIGPASSGTVTLTTNGIPAITSGQPYYLAVSNPNPVAVTFAVEVSYDITTLTNCSLLVSNLVGPGGIPRYFQFDVPTNGAPPGVMPNAASFLLTSATCGVTVVLSEHLPLPDLNHYDYISDLPCTNSQIVMLVSNTTPFPIITNRWYVGVFNSTASNVQFSVEACYSTNYPQIIQLTNAIPFVVPSIADAFAAPPGPPEDLFFEFTVTNQTDGVLFELYNLSGDADLVLQRSVPPVMAPYYDGSFFKGTTPEQIVLRPNPNVPDLRGTWFLGVYNNDPTNVAYTIRATLPDQNGLLVSAQPLHLGLSALPPPRGLLLNWNSVVGERYIIQFTPSLAAPVNWTNVASVTATTTLTTYEMNPIPPGGGFFRIVQVFSFLPILNIQLAPTNQVELSWSIGFPGYTLQSAPSVIGPWTNVTFPPATGIFIIGGQYVVFEPLGPGPKFYRLIK